MAKGAGKARKKLPPELAVVRADNCTGCEACVEVCPVDCIYKVPGEEQPSLQSFVDIDLAKRFELLNRTGQGSMSKVWRARDRSLGRIVCVKVLDKEKTKKFEDRFPGLHRPTEGVICIGLRHKNIVQTFEHGLSKEGEPYLVMELVDGMGLNYLIETQSPQLEGHRIDYLTQIADALEYLHNQGYLHRDLCPRNIMVTREGVVKLIDFGLAVCTSAS